VDLPLHLELPLVLHIRNAEEEGLEVLRAAGLPPYWPVHRHCFTGDWPAAAAWLELYPGSRLGVTAAVTHPDRRAGMSDMPNGLPIRYRYDILPSVSDHNDIDTIYPFNFCPQRYRYDISLQFLPTTISIRYFPSISAHNDIDTIYPFNFCPQRYRYDISLRYTHRYSNDILVIRYLSDIFSDIFIYLWRTLPRTLFSSLPSLGSALP
jgi:hypothetical protein